MLGFRLSDCRITKVSVVILVSRETTIKGMGLCCDRTPVRRLPFSSVFAVVHSNANQIKKPVGMRKVFSGDLCSRVTFNVSGPVGLDDIMSDLYLPRTPQTDVGRIAHQSSYGSIGFCISPPL